MHAANAGVDDAGRDAHEAEAILRRTGPAIERLLREADLPGDATAFVAFVRAAIAARERLKFEFMKDLDLVLETAVELGGELGLGRDDLSFVHVDDLLRFATDSPDGASGARLRRVAGQSRKRFALTTALRLPDLIGTETDVVVMRAAAGTPNFVTAGLVTGPIVALDDDPSAASAGLDGAIVAIRAADPGFDWIFSHRIAGLVTQYGGIGSHMAIRAAEFGLPAAIGCGETIFEMVRTAAAIELDCANRGIRPVAPPPSRGVPPWAVGEIAA
jgi:phosphohistidine swiveling domain-containing protein